MTKIALLPIIQTGSKNQPYILWKKGIEDLRIHPVFPSSNLPFLFLLLIALLLRRLVESDTVAAWITEHCNRTNIIADKHWWHNGLSA